MLVGPKLPQLARSLDEDPAPMALNRVHRTNGLVGHDARHCGLSFLSKLDRPLRHLQSGVLLRMHNPGWGRHTWEWHVVSYNRRPSRALRGRHGRVVTPYLCERHTAA